MQKLTAVLRKEIQELIPPTIFFFIAFNIIALTSALNLRQYGISVLTFAMAALGALVAGKAVLITDKLSFINRFPDKPLIYNVVWKTLIYWLAFISIQYLEHLIHFLFRYGSLSSANRHLFEEVVWPRFWAIQIWLLVLLFVYCGFRELVRVVGRHAVIEMFFRRKV
jgi:hypothetical protein